MTDPLNPNHDEPAEGPRDDAYSAPSGADTNQDTAEKAAPTVRELSAKAAELVAVAADKAAPIAKQAGEATAGASSKLAQRSRVWAAEIREQVSSNGGGASSTSAPE